jgi:hypothetical protein
MVDVTESPSASPTMVDVTESPSPNQVWCYAGSYKVDGECRSCAPGSYSNSDDAVECTKCEVGSFVDFAGASYCYSCDYATEEGAQSCEARTEEEEQFATDDRTYTCETDDTTFTADGTSESGDELQFTGSVEDNSMPVFEMTYLPAGSVNELGLKIELGSVFEYVENGSHGGFQIDEDEIVSQLDDITWLPYSFYNYPEYGFSSAWIQSSDGKIWIYQYVSNYVYNYDGYIQFSPSQMYIAMYVSDYDYERDDSNLAISIVVNTDSFNAEFSPYTQQLARITSSNDAVSGYEANVWWYSFAWDENYDYFYNTTVTVDTSEQRVYLAIESDDHINAAYWGAFIGVQKTTADLPDSTTDSGDNSTDSGISLFDSAASAGLSVIVAIFIILLFIV